jgi:hypothetical protein
VHSSRRAVRVGAVALTLWAVGVAGAPTAAAAEPGPLVWSMDPTSGPIGTEVNVTGSGCADSGFWDGSDGVLAFYNNEDGRFIGADHTRFDVAADGTFSFAFVVPSTGVTEDFQTIDPLPPGDYLVYLNCVALDGEELATFTVTGSGSPPTTSLPAGLDHAAAHASPHAAHGLSTAAAKVAAARAR